jgi:hypothetical protein
MRLSRLLAFVVIGWLALASTASAGLPRSPLTVVPETADFVVAVPSPALLLEAVTTPALLKQAQGLAPVREFLEGTRFRRYLQLIGHVERELSMPLPEILAKVAGGGVVLASKLGEPGGPAAAPALVVVQGTDAKVSERFFALLVQVVEQELARIDGAPKLMKGSYQGFESATIGDLQAVCAGATLLFSNKKEGIKAALDRVSGKEKGSLSDKASVNDARKLLPAEPLAWLWVDMETVRKNPATAEAYKTPRDPLQTTLFGGYFDTLARTPFFALALNRDKDDFAITIRMPVGREGMGPDRYLHVGPDGQPSSRPLLEPKGVLYSTSFHFDTAAFWNERAKLFGADVVKGLEQADKGLQQFPFNRIQISKLLTAAGPYHRIVVVNQPKGGYTKQPKTPVQAFAVVIEMRNPDDFADGVDTLARGGAIALASQFRLKRVEEKISDIPLVGYRFDEERPYPEDPNNERFGFSPCFARVGNQMLLCSTIELAREMIPLLQNEKPGDRTPSAEIRFYGEGVAELLRLQQEELITQAILDQAVPASEARKQVADFLALLRKTGGLSLKATYAPKQFEYEIRARLGDGK